MKTFRNHAEVYRALLEGKKIRLSNYDPSMTVAKYYHLVDGVLTNDLGKPMRRLAIDIDAAVLYEEEPPPFKTQADIYKALLMSSKLQFKGCTPGAYVSLVDGMVTQTTKNGSGHCFFSFANPENWDYYKEPESKQYDAVKEKYAKAEVDKEFLAKKTLTFMEAAFDALRERCGCPACLEVLKKKLKECTNENN